MKACRWASIKFNLLKEEKLIFDGVCLSRKTAVLESEVAKHLNSKLHTQAKKFIAEFNNNPEKCMILDLSHLTNSVDEYLLNFIKQMIMPIRDSQCKPFTTDTPIVTV